MRHIEIVRVSDKILLRLESIRTVTRHGDSFWSAFIRSRVEWQRGGKVATPLGHADYSVKLANSRKSVFPGDAVGLEVFRRGWNEFQEWKAEQSSV